RADYQSDDSPRGHTPHQMSKPVIWPTFRLSLPEPFQAMNSTPPLDRSDGADEVVSPRICLSTSPSILKFGSPSGPPDTATRATFRWSLLEPFQAINGSSLWKASVG